MSEVRTMDGGNPVYDVICPTTETRWGTFNSLNRARLFAMGKSMRGTAVAIEPHSPVLQYANVSTEAWMQGKKLFGPDRW